MNTFAILMQMFFDHQSRTQMDKFREAGASAAEKGRRIAITGVFFTLAAAFIFAAILVFIIDLGLQIDRHQGVAFSGLMVSSLLIAFLGAFCVFVGWLLGRTPSALVEAAAPPPAPPRSELRDLLEQLAVGFLKDFAANQRTNQESRQQSGPHGASQPAAHPNSEAHDDSRSEQN